MINDVTWGIPGASIAAPPPDHEEFTTRPFLSLLRAAAERHAQATALVGHGTSLCYKEMSQLAEAVACAIAERIAPGRPVACLLPRTPRGIAGLLGCLISERLCLVLDIGHPPERQASLLRDAAPDLILLAEPLPFEHGIPVLRLDDASTGNSSFSTDTNWDPDAPFVVYFTSGSSGQPKGIVLSARSVLYRALEFTDHAGLTRRDRLFAPSIHTYAGGLSSLLSAFAPGTAVVLANVAAEGVRAVLQLLEREAITVAVISPPILRLLFQTELAKSAFRCLRSLRIGAASMQRIEMAAWRAILPPDCTIWHSYASTEAIGLANWAVPRDEVNEEATVAAGLLRPNHDYAVLDEDGAPVSPGQPGELILRSRHVALGEWLNGRVVTGRMNPVPDRPGWRSFRTGDLVRVQPDGLLRVLGRADRQVKIDGNRVEPAEIESILRAVPGVIEAAVVAGLVFGEMRIRAFVSTTVQDQAALHATLRRRVIDLLPSALRPSNIELMDKLPTLPSGKVDMLALSSPFYSRF